DTSGYGKVYGRYSATLDTTNEYRRSQKGEFSIEVTDLGVTTRFAYNRFVVWVNRLSSGDPVGNAKVTISGDQGYSRSTQSDAQGLAVFELAPGELAANLVDSATQSVHPMITVEKGSDRASFHAYDSQDSYTSTTYGHSSPAQIESPRPRIMIFTDRGLYKPGEEIALRGIHWDQNPDGFVPYREAYSLELQDPRSGETLWAIEGTASFSGGFAHRFHLPETAEPGEYYVRYTAGKQHGGVSFTIANFRRLNFQVKTSIPDRVYLQGDDLSASVKASYLAGGALPSGNYSYYWTRVPIPFSPPGTTWNGWVFGPGNWEGERTLSEGKGLLGGDGSAVITEKTEGQNAEGAAYRYTVETTVQDVDRQEIASKASITVHPAGFYLGARFGSGSTDGWWSRFVSTGQKIRLDASLVDIDGSVDSTDSGVEIKITRGIWKSSQQQGVYGRLDTRWEYVEEEVQSLTQQTKRGSLGWDFSVKEAGTYLLTLSAHDAKGRLAKTALRFYATGSSWVRRATESPSDINLVPDKTLYLPGETARILVQSPLPDGKYLLTIEREGISEERIITLQGSQTLIEVPIKESYLPVVYVALSAFTKREAPPSDYFEPDLGKPRGLFGIAGLRVSTKPVELNVEVLPLASAYKPGEKADVVVKVTRDGRPVPNAEVTILAVDRGVLDLIDYHVPNPIDFFYDPYNFPLGVYGDDNRRLLMKPVTYDTSALVGGDDEKLKVRKDFNPLALFEPFIATDRNGLAKVSFTLPDTLTTYRLTAVALRENRLGYAEDELLVQNPINVRTALPRKMRLRDTAAGSLILQNLTRDPQKVEVTAASDILTVSGDATKQITVPPGGVYELPFLFAAEREGSGTITFTAKSPVLSEKVQEKMVVEQPLIKEAFTTIGSLSGSETDAREGLVLSSMIAPGYGSLEVNAGATLRPFIDPVLARLSNWQPWSSHYVHLVDSFALVYQKADLSTVQGLMAELAARQLASGGIYTGSWDRYPQLPDEQVSLLSAQFLDFAESHGVSFDKAPSAQKLLAYIDGLKETKHTPYARAYIAYVLSLYGKASSARLKRTEALGDSLGLGGYGLLTQAYLNARDERSARRVYGRSKSFVVIGTQSVDLKQTYEASDYWTSMVAELAMLMKNGYSLKEDFAFIQRVAGSLNRPERHWQTYNDDLWSLLAFIPILDNEAKEGSQATLNIELQNRSLASLELSSSEPQQRKSFSFFDEPLKGFPRDTTMSLNLKKAGSAPLYYSTVLRYALPNET
ncbi:MAG TPA: MG2 domain-containing protein, partial [Spirochaetia bacterium]|nr:MG2 domain-containing protein [Spirochaetia bacterium]